MDAVDVNGGNAEAARENSNLESSSGDIMPENATSSDSSMKAEQVEKMETQEVNGDVKGSPRKSSSPPVRRKLRKFKANSTSAVESDTIPKSKGRKRKNSEIDEGSSEESTDFNGFDSKTIEETSIGTHILKKLLAEAERADEQIVRRSRSKRGTDGHDSDDSKTHTYETKSNYDMARIKREKDSDKSETESIGLSNNTESDMDNVKDDNATQKPSIRSSMAALQKSKSSRLSAPAAISQATTKPKSVVDMSNPAFKEPFKYGWKREMVFRASNDSSFKRMADIYYYTPKGKKVRSFREVAEFLNTKELTIHNFTFFKEAIGLDDPEKEIIRDAKRPRSSYGAVQAPSKKLLATKKAVSLRRSGIDNSSSGYSSTVSSAPTIPPAKVTSKSQKASVVAKSKVSAKKTPQIKMKSSEEKMLPPQRNMATTRRSQMMMEKAAPIKSKRLLTPKVQEPCSIRCSTSMGLIPSLQCHVCLCLYHPECVGEGENTDIEDYVCKNCLQESGDSQRTNLTPPALIPITMLGTQGSKQKHQVTSGTGNLTSTTDKTEETWFAQVENELLQSHDGTLPKPAQNIAVMAGKRYIVVPKNNAMAVQPAITVKSDKIGDKAPMLHDGLVANISSTSQNFINEQTATAEASDEKISETKTDKESSSSQMSSLNQEVIDKNDTELRSDVLDANKVAKEACLLENRSNEILDDTVNMESANVRISQNDNNIDPVSHEKNTIDSQKQDTIRPIGKRRQIQPDVDQQPHFMESVSAGYHALLRIFQYLKVQELLRTARVCRMWRDLAAHPTLWKTVRMKNSQVTDWDGLADTLQRRGTQHLDLRKMLVAGESEGMWEKFLSVIPRVTSLVRLELCRCPVTVVEEVIKSCPQLQVLSAMTIKCDVLNLESVGNLKQCYELRLKAISGMSLHSDLTPLQELTQLTTLSLTSVKELGKKKIEVIQSLTNLEALELGECSDFPDKFGTTVLINLRKLERLRLEKGQGSCCTFDILAGVSQLENLSQMELVNFDVKNGFDKCLAKCKNIKRLLIIPTYISQSATSNNMVLGGVTELSNNLTHFVWGVTLELLRVTELFVDQCNLMNKQVTGDSIPVLKPVPCLKLIADVEDENDNQKGDDKQQSDLTSPQVDILPLPQLQKLLLTALPKTRVKILKIPFLATWRQSISDTAT